MKGFKAECQMGFPNFQNDRVKGCKFCIGVLASWPNLDKFLLSKSMIILDKKEILVPNKSQPCSKFDH